MSSGPAIDALRDLERALTGRRCAVARRENDWLFSCGEGVSIVVSATWRLVDRSAILVADGDDGQSFGHSSPVDVQSTADRLLADRTITGLDVDPVTADLALGFSGALRLDVFNNSSGYEGWTAEFPGSGGSAMIVAMGGGALSVVGKG